MSNSNDSTDPVDVDGLVDTLNDLLGNLHIPISIETPLDLTPSLLLAILESILESRLPISATIRKSRDPLSKVQAMKIFLGVLETDILGEDVGLGDVDPRKLAEGEWDEVVFIGELLCWLGKKYGIIPVSNPNAKASSSRQQEKQPDASRGHRAPFMADAHERTPSPTMQSTATVTTRDSMNSMLSMMHAAPPESDTTMLSMHPDSPSLSVLDLFDMSATPMIEGLSRMRLSTVTPPPRTSAHCIHEVHEPSFMNVGHSTAVHDEEADPDVTAHPRNTATRSVCHCASDDDEERTPTRSNKATPVRYTGWISEVDEDLEIHSFEDSRRRHEHRRPSLLARSTQSDPDPREKFDLYAGITSTSTPRRPSNKTTGRKPSSAQNLTRQTSPTSPTEHTLALMNERARLMEELAKTRSSLRQWTPQR